MNHIKNTIFLVLLFVTFSISADTLLSKSSVNELMDNIQEAVHAQDVEALSSFFTEDASIIVEMPKNMGGTLKLKTDQYKEMLRQSWAMSAKYTYDVKNIEIKISQDKKSATVTDLTIETVEMMGQTIKSKSYETMNVIISGGTPKINNLYGKIEL